jgi:glycosyltransferase involved in cell wall biosynthesis
MREQRAGFAAALNTGIRAATAPRIGFLLSDDWLHERAVEECLAFDTDIVSTGLRRYSEDGTRVFETVCHTPSLDEFHQQPTLERKASYLKHFLFFDKETLLKVGGVDETIGLTGPDDFDLIWTLLENGASVSVVGQQLYNYRDHTKERLTLRSVKAQIGDLCKILDKHGVYGEERQEIISWHSLSYGQPYHVTRERRKGMIPPGHSSRRM